ncbi:MAG: phosphoribosylaminoimidazolesuccinocarboxamide synthase [Spirochaetales bacterium]|nr:phosphoribosylaminoimidazolesuccinocarboxamide synthase [Spirochaetales bacterium]
MREVIEANLSKTFKGLNKDDVGKGVSLYQGKVRDVVDLGEKLIITTSDRISAFDRVLSTIPFKGEILNKMALYWFDKTSDIIENHIDKKVSARSISSMKCKVLPVEVIVRGYLTGSAWRDYKAGNAVSGITLPAGMKADQKFEKPLLTPSTKAEQGEHDMPISGEEIVKQGLVEAKLWKQVEEVAMALFERGTKLAAERGLILVDTKYEFGLKDGRLVLVDEVHTPDSSRFWYADTYQELFEAGESQRKVDKEFLREWLMDIGFMGNGESPVIPDNIRVEVAQKYIQAYELITGEKFIPESLGPEEELKLVLSSIK